MQAQELIEEAPTASVDATSCCTKVAQEGDLYGRCSGQLG